MLLRFSIALLLTIIIFFNSLKNIDKKTFIHGTILGICFGTGFVLQTFGLKFTSISKSSFITGITVVLTPFAYKLITRKYVKLWQKLGVIVCFIGLWLFTKPRLDVVNLGDALTLLSTVCWALYITFMDVFTKNSTRREETAQLLFMQILATFPFPLITLFLFDSSHGFAINWTPSLILSLSFNAILATFLVTFIQTSVQRYTSPVKAALIYSLEPVIATYLAVMIAGEILSGAEYIGALIMMGGVLLSEFGKFIIPSKSD